MVETNFPGIESNGAAKERQKEMEQLLRNGKIEINLQQTQHTHTHVQTQVNVEVSLAVGFTCQAKFFYREREFKY